MNRKAPTLPRTVNRVSQFRPAAFSRERNTSNHQGLIANLEIDSDILVVAFGALAIEGDTPRFEFVRVLREVMPVKTLFMRDYRQSWYHRGIMGVASSVEGVELILTRIVADAEPTRLVMLGASAGGYGALLFGSLVGATEVHAFAPQTFLSSALRLRHRDFRWQRQWSRLILSGRYRPRYANLRRVMRKPVDSDTRFYIHYSDAHRCDTAHASHVAGLDSVTHVGYPYSSHNVLGPLRKSGQLDSLIRKIVAG